jgi:hypothetical protein
MLAARDDIMTMCMSKSQDDDSISNDDVSTEEPCVPVVLRGVWCDSRVKVHVGHNLCSPNEDFGRRNKR